LSASSLEGICETLTIAQLAIAADTSMEDAFRTSAKIVHTMLDNGDHAIRQYALWRLWTFREVTHDFLGISESLKALYYRSYSLYIDSTAICMESSGRILFCDTQCLFESKFEAVVRGMLSSIERIKDNLKVVYANDTCDDTRVETLGTIIACNLQDGLVYGLEKFREELDSNVHVFASMNQRIRVFDHLRGIQHVVELLIAYVQSVLKVFGNRDTQVGYGRRLDDVLLYLRRNNWRNQIEFIQGSSQRVFRHPITRWGANQ
jgi:hypothetical protein